MKAYNKKSKPKHTTKLKYTSVYSIYPYSLWAIRTSEQRFSASCYIVAGKYQRDSL